MLCLTRRVNEEIVIGGDVVVKIIGIRNGAVKLGIMAPKEVTVNRREVQEKVDAGTQAGNVEAP